MGNIYVGHPTFKYCNSLAELVELCRQHPEQYGGWNLRPCAYRPDASLIARDFCSLVLQSPGPVVLLRQVQNNTVEEVRRRLGARVPVIVENVINMDGLLATLNQAINQFEGGEPLVALDLVVAFLMIRKFDQEHMWTGNAKGYLWAGDIPKGRGLDTKYEPRVGHVLNILLQQDLVVSKISNGKKKYALNPDRREQIYEILRIRKFPDHIERPLLRHAGLETVRTLDCLAIYDVPAR
jgi:hypothetical protein